MRRVHVIVEGPKDLYFLLWFVLHRFNGVFGCLKNCLFEQLKNLKSRFVLESTDGNTEFHIYCPKGFAKVDVYRSSLSRPVDLVRGDDFSAGIIFDADDTPPNGALNTNHSGIASRPEFILDLLNIRDLEMRQKAKQQIFLFPDNQTDGDLESLMERMIHPTPAHKMFLDVCWKSFENCVERNGFIKPTRKSRMNEFTAAFNPDTWADNGINRSFELSSLWDWNSSALNPLYDFLSQLLTGTPAKSFDGLVEKG